MVQITHSVYIINAQHCISPRGIGFVRFVPFVFRGRAMLAPTREPQGSHFASGNPTNKYVKRNGKSVPFFIIALSFNSSIPIQRGSLKSSNQMPSRQVRLLFRSKLLACRTHKTLSRQQSLHFPVLRFFQG